MLQFQNCRYGTKRKLKTKRTVINYEKNDITHQPPEAVDVVKLIKIICLKGNGNEDPIRKVERYYDLNGTFIFEKSI